MRAEATFLLSVIVGSPLR
jgi:hypothetical protein